VQVYSTLTSPFWGKTSPFYGKTSPFGGKTSPFGGKTSPFWGKTSPKHHPGIALLIACKTAIYSYHNP